MENEDKKKELLQNDNKRVVLKRKEPVEKKRLRGRCPICTKMYEKKVHNQKLCGDPECKKKYKAKVKTKEWQGEAKCTCCHKFFPKSELNSKGVCKTCVENHQKKCPFCSTLFYTKKDKRIFCSLRCTALSNQKKATEANEGPKHDLQEILDDILPLIQIDTPVSEACEYTGWAMSTVQNYLTGPWDLEKYPEIKEFRSQVRKARAFIKVASRQVLSKSIVDKKDLGSAKYIISNRDKRYQGGYDEEGNGGKQIVVRFAAGKSPFIQPQDDLSGNKTNGEDFDA